MKIEALLWVMTLALKRPDPYRMILAEAVIGELDRPGKEGPRRYHRLPGRWPNNRANWRPEEMRHS
ncbi:MAG: hypothetical protein ACR2PO_08215 [Methyloligellaceae bacterium]